MPRLMKVEKIASSVVLGASATWTGPTRDFGQLCKTVLFINPEAVTGTFSIYLNGRADMLESVDVILNRATGLSAKAKISVSDEVALYNTSTDASALPVITPQVVTAGASSLTFSAWLISQVEL